MSYNVKTLSVFEKNLKKLAKKYPSIKSDFLELLDSLEINPSQGTALGNNTFKVRMKITSKNKGKSGGARVITNIYVQKETVFLLTIYDKSEESTISDKEILELVKLIDTEF